MRVLVVDDAVDSTESTAMLLRQLGYEVDTAHNMDGAIRAAQKFNPRVAVLDIGMRGGDGLQLARYLRVFYPQCRLIAFTGLARPADALRSREAGFERHVVKASEPELLLRAIEDLI